MKLSTADLHHLADLAIDAATEAGQLVARSRPSTVEHKAEGHSLASQVVTEIDRHSEDIIVDIVGPTLERYELGLLTEERDDDGGRFANDHFWCIDPIDGTLPFIEGTPGYAVSIALVGRDGTPWIGVVYDPVEEMLLHAIKGVGAFSDGDPWSIGQQSTGASLSVFADRSFVDGDDHDEVVAALEHLADEMDLDGVQLHATAGAVMNACGVLANPPACYFKVPKPTGGGALWDFAATACLFGEVGAIVTDVSGGPLELNRAESTAMNHRGAIFATDADLAQRIRAIVHPPQ